MTAPGGAAIPSCHHGIPIISRELICVQGYLSHGMVLAFKVKAGEGLKGASLEEGFTILVADRNSHVRQFLKREMEAEGYHVLLARNGHEVLQCVRHEPLDLIILDLDLPDVREMALLNEIKEQRPALPVVVHTFLTEYIKHPVIRRGVFLVEKKGSNVEGLKGMVFDLLKKFYPKGPVHQGKIASKPSCEP